MTTPVTIRLLTDDPSPARIQNVIVDFYDTSAVFQTSGTTDINGETVVSLPDGSYDLMFFKTGVTIQPSQPQRIVVDHALTNIFQVTGHVRAMPESTDPTKCKVSGTIKGVGGNYEVTRLIFEPVMSLLVQGGQLVAPSSRVEYTSDDTGYFEFELLRNQKYNGYFVFPMDLFKVQPGQLDIITPNLPSVDIAKLLFPLPINMLFSATTLSLTAGGAIDTSVTATLSFSDGSVRTKYGTPWAGISVTIDDNTIVTPSLTDDGKLSLRPLKAGVATITTARDIPSTVFFDPLPDYTSSTIVVTVT